MLSVNGMGLKCTLNAQWRTILTYVLTFSDFMSVYVSHVNMFQIGTK